MRHWTGFLFRGATSGRHSGRKRPRAPRLAIELLEARLVPSFLAPRSYDDAGSRPSSVAVGDFNGDGIQDLVVANQGTPPNYTDGSVSILLGTGDGTFQPAHTFAAGSLPNSVVVGDFNGDGTPDLAVADENTNTVSVLLGNGDGSFQPARTFAAGSQPFSVAVGDFNGDGIQDLAIADPSSNTVSILLGTGDGTFQPATTFAAGSGPESVAVGDFNGDGIPDLAVANDSINHVSVLLGNGDGSFQPATTFAAGSGPNSLAVGDFNGDGILDLAVTNNRSNDVSVLLGTGDGSFQPAMNYAVGERLDSAAVGDFNGDGIPDLVMANTSVLMGVPNVSVLLGNGDGSFQPATTFATGPGPISVAVGDFNGDNIPDLVVAHSGDPNGNRSGVTVLLGTGDGSFQTPRTYNVGMQFYSVAVGDFNGDGTPDLAAAGYIANLTGGVSVLLGNGDGTFQPAQTFAAGIGPNSVAVGDFNGDGIPDLAVADGGVFGQSSVVSVLLGNGDGTFQPARSFAVGSGPVWVVVGDFNGDGIPDLAVANYASNTVSVLLGNGDGSFQPAHTLAAGSGPESVTVGDFNGDGIQDLIVADDGGGVSVLLGNGDGSFQPARTFAVGSQPQAVAVGDFNGDGIPDLAVANFGSNNMSVLLGNGDGSFQPARNITAGYAPESVVTGDFNGDGIPDLAVVGYSGIRVLLGNGDGSFQIPNFSYVTGAAFSVAVGDFNGDGLSDLAVANLLGSVVILTNDGNWTGPAPQRGHAPAPRRAVHSTSQGGHSAKLPGATLGSPLVLAQEHAASRPAPLPAMSVPYKPASTPSLGTEEVSAFHEPEGVSLFHAVTRARQARDAFSPDAAFAFDLLDMTFAFGE